MRELRIEGFDSFVEGSLSIEGSKSKVTWIQKDFALSFQRASSSTCLWLINLLLLVVAVLVVIVVRLSLV